MKQGIVSPAYNPNELVTYNYGPSAANAVASTNPPTEDNYQTMENVAGYGVNVNGAFYGVAMHWDVTPGTRTITGFTYSGGFLQATHIHAWAVDVWREDGAVFTLVATSGLITADPGSTGSITLIKTLDTPVTVTLESGKKYYIGFRLKRTAQSASTPYLSRSLTGTFAQDSFAFVASPTGLDSGVLSKSLATGVSYVSTTHAETIPRFCITYTSPNFIEQQIIASSPIDKTYLLANADSHPYVHKLEGVAVGDTKSLTVEIRDFSGAATENLLESLELDCGNTVASQNDMIFNSKTVNLPAIGGQSQAGDTMDLIFGWRHNGAYKKYDLYWQNRYQDDGFHSHAVKFAGTRGTLYSYSSSTYEPRFIRFTGAYNSLAKILVGVKPMVIIGDSQCIQGYGVDTLRSPNTDRLGGIPTSLAKPRIWILHGQSGKSLASSTTGVEATLFRSATAGAGDGVELLGLGCTWLFGGIGVNDISAATTANTYDAAATAANLTRAICSIAQYILDASEDLYLVGLPPYSHTGNTDEFEAKAARWLNRALAGLALAWRVPYYNPWPDMVQPGTEDDAIPTFASEYTVDGGLHYSTTGGTAVVANVVKAIEQGLIDLRDQYDSDAGGYGADGYTDATRVAQAVLAARNTVRDSLQGLLSTFGDDVEALIDSFNGSTRDKQAFRDQLLDLARWIAATMR